MKELKNASEEFIRFINIKYPQIQNQRVNYALTGRLSAILSCGADKIIKIGINNSGELTKREEEYISRKARERYLQGTSTCGDIDFLEIKNKSKHEMNPLLGREEHKTGDSLPKIISRKDLPKQARKLFSGEIIKTEVSRSYLKEKLRLITIGEQKAITSSISQYLSAKFINLLQRRNEEFDTTQKLENEFKLIYDLGLEIYPKNQIIKEIYSNLTALKKRIDKINQNGNEYLKTYRRFIEKRPLRIARVKELYYNLLEYDSYHDQIFF